MKIDRILCFWNLGVMKVPTIRYLLAVLLIGVTVSCGVTQDCADSPERTDLIDDPFVSGLRRCIRLAKLDELEDFSNNRKSEEIRLWIGFDESPLYGILLRRAELSFSGDIISCHENQYSIERLQLSNAEWSEIWKDVEKSELRELQGTEEFGFSDKYLDDTNVVVEYRNNCNYRRYRVFGFDDPTLASVPPVDRVSKFCSRVSKKLNMNFWDTREGPLKNIRQSPER